MDIITLAPLPSPALPELARLHLIARIVQDHVERHPYLMGATSWARCWIFGFSRYVISIDFRLLRVSPEDACDCVTGPSFGDRLDQEVGPGLHIGDEIK